METYIRNCPNCTGNIIHASKKSYKQCKKDGLWCRSCSAKRRIKVFGNNTGFLKCAEKGSHTGKDNPFYGQKHTDETRQKFKNRDTSYRKEVWYRDLMSKAMSGDKNPMFGKSVYETWIKNYGKEKADVLLEEWKKKQSANSSGINNPMYGKPSPQGSGNGWSGWYGKFYFRSLKELSYVVDLDKKGIKWSSAENIKIKYVNWNGVERTYLPDFVVGNCIVEVKPTRLRSSRIVRLKQQAAELYCSEKAMSYLMVDPDILSKEEIKSLRDARTIKFTDRYEKLYMEKYNVNCTD